MGGMHEANRRKNSLAGRGLQEITKMRIVARRSIDALRMTFVGGWAGVNPGRATAYHDGVLSRRYRRATTTARSASRRTAYESRYRPDRVVRASGVGKIGGAERVRVRPDDRQRGIQPLGGPLHGRGRRSGSLDPRCRRVAQRQSPRPREAAQRHLLRPQHRGRPPRAANP